MGMGAGLLVTADLSGVAGRRRIAHRCFRAPGAPGERQPAPAGLYSGAMIMPPPYRPAASPVFNPAPSPVINPAPSPVECGATGGAECGANGGAAGFGADIFLNRAIYASRRGVPLKKRNFVRVLSNFAPVLAAPFAPGGYLTPTLRVSPSPFTERGLRPSEGGEVCPCQLPLPTATATSPASSLKPLTSSPAF